MDSILILLPGVINMVENMFQNRYGFRISWLIVVGRHIHRYPLFENLRGDLRAILAQSGRPGPVVDIHICGDQDGSSEWPYPQ